MCIFWYKCQGNFLRKVLSLLEHPKINFFSLFLLLYMQQSINCWTHQLTYIHQVWLHEQKHTTFLVKVCLLPFSMKWEYSSQFSMMIWRFLPFSHISYTSQIIQTVTSICLDPSLPVAAKDFSFKSLYLLFMPHVGEEFSLKWFQCSFESVFKCSPVQISSAFWCTFKSFPC